MAATLITTIRDNLVHTDDGVVRTFRMDLEAQFKDQPSLQTVLSAEIVRREPKLGRLKRWNARICLPVAINECLWGSDPDKSITAYTFKGALRKIARVARNLYGRDPLDLPDVLDNFQHLMVPHPMHEVWW